MNLVNPYENTGIDYTGTNGKADKMYLSIFTRLTIRSIDIEIVQDMSTKAFVQAFIRFCNSYGSARGVMVIVVGIGHGDTSSNPGRD